MNIESFNNDKHLSYEELVEYSRGNLSNSEMHRLEQHLIGCELCNEALEGISSLGDIDAAASIEKIKAATGTKEEKGLGLYHYIGIAASIIIIAVIGFVFTRTADEPELMAEEAAEAMDEGIADIGYANPEQIIPVDSSEETSIDTTMLAMTDMDREVAEPVTSEPVVREEISDTSSLPGVQPAVARPGAGEELIVADLDIKSPDSTLINQAAEDSTVIVMAEIAEEEDQQDAAKSRMVAPTEAIPSQEKALEEVAQGAYVAAEPPRGQRAYDRYLRRNLEYPEAARDNNIEGDVVSSPRASRQRWRWRFTAAPVGEIV